MNAIARPWIGLVFKCCAALALIVAFVFFMRMQEDQSFIDRYRADGTVSRAVVIGMERDTLTTTTRKGRSRRTDIQMLTVRFNPKSGLKYADYTGQADIPSAPPPTGNPMADSEFSEVIWVSNTAFEATKVGDSFVVVDTPYYAQAAEGAAQVQINGVPAGNYKLRVWHPRMAPGAAAHEQPVAVPATGNVRAAAKLVGLAP